MILTINGKNYELTFGLGFLAEMNKRKSAEFEGMKTGYGAMALFSVGQFLGDPLAYRDWETDRKSTRLNSSHSAKSRMPSSA